MIEKNAHQPGDTLEVGGSVWLRSGAETLGGAARIALLAAIRETGSITGAAKSVGMSYKAAWDAIDAMNNLAGEPLVVRASGGKGGGGTTLTPAALRLIEGFAENWQLISRIGMRTSARNQLAGKVATVMRGTVNDEVQLALPGGQVVVAVVTHESTEALGLVPGRDAVALIKASWVMLMTGDPARLSARNQLQGTVARVTRGAVNAEVSLAIDDSTTVTAIVTNESIDTLALAAGRPAVAVFKASSVILGAGFGG
jgi:molybdate transport system regulatory protein